MHPGNNVLTLYSLLAAIGPVGGGFGSSPVAAWNPASGERVNIEAPMARPPCVESRRLERAAHRRNLGDRS
jgi:hypothetical protein